MSLDIYKSLRALGGDEDDGVTVAVEEALESGAHTLDLSFRGLKELPAVLKTMRTTLEALELDNNFEMCSLDPTLGSLTRLRSLNASYCGITVLSADIGRLVKLEALRLSNNRIAHLPAEVWQLKALTTLCIDNNKLHTLPGGLLFLPRLAEVTYENNPFYTVEELERELDLHSDDAARLAAPPELLPTHVDCASCWNRTPRSIVVIRMQHLLRADTGELPFVFYVCSEVCRGHLVTRLTEREEKLQRALQ